MDFYRSKKKTKKGTDAEKSVKDEGLSVKDAILQSLLVEKAKSQKKLLKEVYALLGCEESEDKKAEFTKSLDKLKVKGRVTENEEGAFTKVEKPAKVKTDKPDKPDKKRKAPAASGDEDAEGSTSAAPDNEEDEDAPLKKKSAKDASVTGYSAASAAANIDLSRNGEQAWRDGLLSQEYLASNPDGITRLFVGNLNRKITEEELRACIEGITHIKWITDKQTREFYGSTFLELKDAKCAAVAVQKDKSKFMGRPLKIYYCPPRPGDIWPPRFDEGFPGAGGGGEGRSSSAKPRMEKEKSVKPAGTCRV